LTPWPFDRRLLIFGAPVFFVSGNGGWIFDLWMQCWTQEQIAEAVGITREAITKILVEMAGLPKLPKTAQAAAEHATDFETRPGGS
jgi:hypothetical protein